MSDATQQNEPFPDPRDILDQAIHLVPERTLADYSEAVAVLKNDKNLTFREIAKWLQERGIPCDHNGVYRVYTQGLPKGLKNQVRDEDELEEKLIEQEEREK